MVYLCLKAGEKRFLCSSSIEITYPSIYYLVLFFVVSTQKYVLLREVAKKVAHGKNNKNAKQLCQIAIFISKTATESIKPDIGLIFNSV